MKRLLCGSALAAILLSPAFAAAPEAVAVLRNASGAQIGRADFTQTPHGVNIVVRAKQLPPGDHAVHIHDVGKCDTADGFKSAGAHFNPAGKEHGRLNPKGQHAGDMDNQKAGDSGELAVTIVNANVTLEVGANSLFDADGSSLVIHAQPDDYKSQPAGSAGDRIACGVIEHRLQP
jgi:Cu-Zn family superoxide dismutase